MRVPVMTLPGANSDAELERQVLERLKWLKFGALERGVQVLLRSEGFREVTIVGNMHWRGRSRFGGLDIRGWLPSAAGRLFTIVQVKQPEPGLKIQRRFVDELRGVMDRIAAARALIVTTGQFSKPAIEAAAMYPRKPVRLISGRQLAKLMVKNCVGVRVKPLILSGRLPELVLDELFFERLEELAP